MSVFCKTGKTITDFQADIESKRTSFVDATRDIFDLIDQYEQQLNAYVSIFQDSALKRASQFDDEAKHCRKFGSLFGVPVAIKDLFDYAGTPTRAGSLATSDETATKTAYCVQKLIDAGANIVGKTQTVEFAFGGWGTNQNLGTPWNPWDLTTHRVPGGSSSGSAVAVASGMALAALGTDTGGSIRTPASHCGLVGAKTSSGLISNDGVFPLCPSLDTVGTLTRNVEDAAIILSAISGPDESDKTALKAPIVDYLSDLNSGVVGLNIAVLNETELKAASDDVLALFEQSRQSLVLAGANLKALRPPKPLRWYLDECSCLMSYESYRNLSELMTQEASLVSQPVRERILAGASISESQYVETLERRALAQQEFLTSFIGVDALIMPTCSNTAIPVASVDETEIVTPFGRMVNYLDLAAVSVPMGTTPEGLPTGLQVVVRKYEDALALRIAQVVEKQIIGNTVSSDT